MWEKFKQWFADTFVGQPASIAPMQPNPTAAPREVPLTPGVLAFLHDTQMGSPNQPAMLGKLTNQVLPWEFADYCASFVKGVNYVAQRFGTCPKTITITDDEVAAPHYNSQTQTIFLPRKMLYYALSGPFHRQSKTEPYVLDNNEDAVVRGVEESFHHYQMTTLGNRYAHTADEIPSTQVGDYDGFIDGYDNHPLEYDAERIVRQAIIHFGYDKHMFQMIPNERPITWRKRIEKTDEPVITQPVTQAAR